METVRRYRHSDVRCAGVLGQNLTIPSADPVNHHQAITDLASAPQVDVDAKLFVPPGAEGPVATVVIVPGSLGVGPNHEMHAATLVEEGFGVCVLDPFGPRSVASTIGDQTPYSFAASALDVLMTLKVLAERPEVDADRIAAQGHSRGGSAVTIAANRRFADPIVGPGCAFAAVYAVYPWAGQQFVDPSIGPTRYRAIIGERDEWCSVQQVQGLVAAIRAAGGDASMRIVPRAHHSFDRHEEPHILPDARVSPHAPTVFLADDGAMIRPGTDEPDPTLTDADIFRAAAGAGFARRGAAIGGTGNEPETFRADMLAFHEHLRSPT